MRLNLPRTVVILGLVSFLNDAASEMITPLLPLFLTLSLGAGPAAVGLVEGVAEATASILKLVSGRLADRGWSHKRLVVGGYTVSNAARPLIGLALGWTWVLALRFLDRVGKGIRTSPRDALIAGAAHGDRRGWAFGFHRALDNLGAVLGPLTAFALLQWGLPLGHVFLWSVVPGVLVVTLLVAGLPASAPAARLAPAPVRWSALDPALRRLILATGGLALASAPEVFLVLWATDRGLAVAWVPLVWAAASAVKAAVAGPAGALSDRLGRTPVLLGGWGLRILLLAAFATVAATDWLVWALFLGYAGALAATEGPERAFVGDRAGTGQRATAFGVYHMVTGLAALPGAVIFGSVWQAFGSNAAFGLAALVSAASASALLVGLRR